MQTQISNTLLVSTELKNKIIINRIIIIQKYIQKKDGALQINLHFFYFNPLYTGFHSRSLSKAIDILYDSFFHFCYELALET